METGQEHDLPLEIGHVLFVDIVGYSKLLINEQTQLLEHLKEIVRGSEQVRSADAAGKLIRLTTGDGMALVFRNSPEAPARCALELAKADHNHPELQLRMGINSGPINEVADVNDRANFTGAGINMAQRVMDCGDAGHILLSKHAAEDLAQYRHWHPLLHDLGECEVKHGLRVGIVNLVGDGVGNPELPHKFKTIERRQARVRRTAIAVALLLFAGIVAAFVSISKRSSGWTSTVPDKSIAVLPFENLSSDKENAYFAEGVQDEILTRLAKIADLKVISRTSTQHYKSVPNNLPEIAHQLGVANILEGSVQRSGDAVRVNVQLIKAANDSQLWADTFDRKLTDIFSVESEVAKTIAEKLRAKLSGQEEQVITAKPTDNTEAYDAYLRGLAYSLKTAPTAANALGAQRYLKEAVRLDPKFALAWALLSFTDSRGYNSAALQPTVALREEARQAAETALTLQPNLGEAVHAMGYFHQACLKDYEAAVRYYAQASPLLPNSSRIPESRAYLERKRDHWDQSESYFNEAERLDPRNVLLLTQHALSYSYFRRFRDALRELDQVLNITPDDVDTLALEAAIAQAEGDLPRAAAILAPLHPAVDDNLTVVTKIYQAILERQPASIIPWLKEVLAKPDPALGYFNVDLRFSLGWAQEVAGDHTAAEESWRQARTESEPFLKEYPKDSGIIGSFALTNIVLGNKSTAFAQVEQAMALTPIETDPLNGSPLLEILARVAARGGETNRAIGALQRLRSMPCGSIFSGSVPLTPALLRLDPMFDSLRSDPRFQKLCQDKQ